ncbi:hypothetical protein CR513_04696, partial [Mucuna pruriens]
MSIVLNFLGGASSSPILTIPMPQPLVASSIGTSKPLVEPPFIPLIQEEQGFGLLIVLNLKTSFLQEGKPNMNLERKVMDMLRGLKEHGIKVGKTTVLEGPMTKWRLMKLQEESHRWMSLLMGQGGPNNGPISKFRNLDGSRKIIQGFKPSLSQEHPNSNPYKVPVEVKGFVPTLLRCLDNIIRDVVVNRKYIPIEEDGKKIPRPSWNKDQMTRYLVNSKARNFLMFGLAEVEYVKVHGYKSSKEMWDTQALGYKGTSQREELHQRRYNKTNVPFWTIFLQVTYEALHSEHTNNVLIERKANPVNKLTILLLYTFG